jgi:16S rRNA (uracil1498-N3)-methyltransferase
MSQSGSIRLYVSDDLSAGVQITLSADQSRYVVQVMRRSAGDDVALFNGRHGEWRAEVISAHKKSAVLQVVVQSATQTPLKRLSLLFAPVKRGAIDTIAQKATELGVTRLQPVITARTNADRVNVERLQSIATEAAEQCERLDVPEVVAPQPLESAFQDWPAGVPLYLMDETGAGAPVAAVLASEAARAADSAAFVIGPEGGFTDSELDLMRGLPFSTSISLGSRILRADTAALAALTCWQALCGDWRRPVT